MVLTMMQSTPSKLLLISAILVSNLAACSQPEPPLPSAEDVKWSVARNADRTGYDVQWSATLQDGISGWYKAVYTLTDDRGCIRRMAVDNIIETSSNQSREFPGSQKGTLELKRPISSAELEIVFVDDKNGTATSRAESKESSVFYEDRMVDASVAPKDFIEDPCGKQKTDRSSNSKELREKAKTDPDGADADAIDAMSRGEVVATAINTAGFLCARVLDMRMAGNEIVAKCIEYRTGEGRVTYRINVDTMQVRRAG